MKDSAYEVQISVKHNNLVHKIFLWQHVSTLLSHHQAFQRADQIIQINQTNLIHQSLRFIARRLNTAQHVSGILMPIIKSL